ncbi:MAG: thermostable hemolysin [Burkholderiaceae bacterium]
MILSLPAPCRTVSPPWDAPSASLDVLGPEDDGRAELEAFIARVYARRYGARVTRFTPCLAGLRDPLSGQWLAAAGYRRADEGPLFLERYLDAPVEHLLGGHQGQAVDRHDVVEVGHLAAERPGAGRLLIPLLGQHLVAESALWVVSTLTQELRHLFVRMGVTPIALGHADPSAVGDELPDWGSYYEHQPVVLAGRLDAALRLMHRRQSGPVGGMRSAS